MLPQEHQTLERIADALESIADSLESISEDLIAEVIQETDEQ